MPVPESQGTVREALESIRRQGGNVPELEPVKCPQEVMYIWIMWLNLSKRRHGQNPISYSDIDAWARLSGVCISMFEMQTLDQIETLYFQELRRQRESK